MVRCAVASTLCLRPPSGSLTSARVGPVAKQYDVMNDVMSAGVHRVWKEQFVAALNPQPGMKLLDVAGGTGDIAFR